MSSSASTDRPPVAWTELYGDDTHVFVSYARSGDDDVAGARALVAALRDRGVRTWLADEQLTGGDERLDLVDAAIDSAIACVACLGAGVRNEAGQHELGWAAARAVVNGGFVLAVVRLPGYTPQADRQLPAAFRSALMVDISSGDFVHEKVGLLASHLWRARRPEATVPRSDADRASADPTPPPEPPPEPFDVTASVTSDTSTAIDLLGFEPLVRALDVLLSDHRTELPLAIAITAPWGAGKSSVMAQLKNLLDSHMPLAPGNEETPAGRTAATAGSTRTWRTVEFPAWKYERSERLWAALVKAIYDQSLKRMSWRQKVWFRLRLDWARLGPVKATGVTAVPLLAAATAILTALSTDLTRAGSAAAGISAAAFILGTLSRYGTMLVNPFKRAIEKYAERPDYEAHLGFTAAADEEIGHLIKLLAPDRDHGLAVFVDDLDRCSSAHVVEVVEAMNQIFNTGRNQCAFILGLDRDVVAANIEVAYAKTVRQLRRDRNPLGENFGAQYLAKLVQLAVAIPEPDAGGVRRLLEKIVGAAPPGQAPAPSEAEIQRADAQIVEQATDETPASARLAAAEIAATGSVPKPSLAVAERRVLARRLRDSPLVIEAEYAALTLLEPNPRQIKRFHNAFRLQLYVASEDDRVSFDFSPDQLAALARSVALRQRWPHIADAIARDGSMLSTLERLANGGDGTESVNSPHPERWLTDATVLGLFRDENPSRRLSALRLGPFVRVT